MKRTLFILLAIVSVAGMILISGCKKPKTYTITFNANGGTGTMRQQVFTEGEQKALKKNEFTRDGCDFSGWNGNGANFLDEQIISVTTDLTLYALWTSNTPQPLVANAPIVQTNAATNITATAARLNGNVISNEGAYITERGFLFGTEINDVSQKIMSDVGNGSFFVILMPLSPNTTYFYKAYASNSEGTSYGDIMYFTTTSQIGTRGEPFTDVRDGNTYSTVNIGSQTWMGENLRYEGNSAIGSYEGSYVAPYRYYPNNDAKNVSTYGYLYNWPAVMNGQTGSETNPSGVQGICPNGWHLPSVAEWAQLADYLGDTDNAGAMLAGTNLWIDDYPDFDLVSSPYFGTTVFNALPAGYTKHFGDPPSATGGYYEFGETAAFYTTTDSGDYTAHFCSIHYHSTAFSGAGGDHNKCSAFSVRCIRDN